MKMPAPPATTAEETAPHPGGMRRRIPHLSKSRFMSGLQCHKRLYLQLYEPEASTPTDDAGEAIFSSGHTVGRLARDLYRGGMLVDEDLEWPDAMHATTAALRDRAIPAIFEAAFSFDRVRVRADILARTRTRRFDLIEVKSTLDVKPEHRWDLAIQYYVLRGAGLPIRRARLMHLNRDYVYAGGAYDLKQLFTFSNLTRLVSRRKRQVVAAIKAMRKMVAAKSAPSIGVGSQCSSPYPCPFYEHCRQNEPDHSIDQLPRLGTRLREQLTVMGIIEIPQIPADFYGLSTLQARVVEAVRTERRFHDEGISRELHQARFPVHFVDFETFNPALPLYPGTSPYQVIPFQWSDHILNADGAVTHREFLHTERSDPRPHFINSLLEAVGRRGSIIVYGSFESTRLKELAEQFPARAPALECVRTRIIDLLPLIRAHVYDPGFHGSFSIKSVLPALIPGLGYDDLEIGDGNSASLAYAEIQDPQTSSDRADELACALRAYCGRDTQALLELYRILR
jgi:hypothetical protein